MVDCIEIGYNAGLVAVSTIVQLEINRIEVETLWVVLRLKGRRYLIERTYVKREIISLSSIVPKMVFSLILNPLQCKIGRTAPDSAGSMYLCACQALRSYRKQ